MANYHDLSTRRADDPERIAVAMGSDDEGNERVCVSLEGAPIHAHLAPEWDEQQRWVSLSPECARRLYEQLAALKHTFLPDSGPLFSPEAPTLPGRRA